MIRPKVSVVVPIYNVEKYLRECVDSILGQTLKEIEVILVDDGSPDKCGQIVDEYAAQDKRVVAIHQKNSGYTAAVNYGIEIAKGEYIGIIESDDWIEPDMYETLYANAKANKTDITKGGFYYYNSTLAPVVQNQYYANPSGIDLRLAPERAFRVEEWPRIIGFHASIWSSIYRAEFIKEIKLPETAGASYQDFPFMIDAMTKAERITVVKKAFVHWRNDPKQGNSTSAGGKKLLLMVQNTETGLEILKRSGKYEALKEPFYAHALWTNIGFFYRIDKQYKKEYFRRLHKIFEPLKDDTTFTYRYFRPEDMVSVEALIHKNHWIWFQLSHIRGGVRRRTKAVLRRVLPTFRVVNTNHEELQRILAQNKEMKDELEDIKNLLERK